MHFYASAFRRWRHYVFGLPVRPSVRPSEAWNNLFSSVHGSVGPSDQPWPFSSMSVRPSVRPPGEVSGHLSENAWREWSEILHVDVSWALSELIRLWSWSVDFPPFGITLTLWNGSNFGFPGITRRTLGWTDLKFCMLMYLAHLQHWLIYDDSLLIFLILAFFLLSEMGQILGFRAFSGESMEGMAWNFACGCILTTFRTD